MHTTANEIRSYASKYVREARLRGEWEVSIQAGQIHRELRLENSVPAVCSALKSKQFSEDNHVEIVGKEGPPSGQSTTTRYTYRLLGEGAEERPSSLLELRGVGKTTYAALGGGEEFLRSQRAEFDRK